MSTNAPRSLVVIVSSSAGSLSKYYARFWSGKQDRQYWASSDQAWEPMKSLIDMVSFHETDPSAEQANTGTSGRSASEAFIAATQKHFETEDLGVLAKTKRLLQWDGTTAAIKDWVQRSAKDPALTVVLLDTDKDECEGPLNTLVGRYNIYADDENVLDNDVPPEEFNDLLLQLGEWKV